MSCKPAGQVSQEANSQAVKGTAEALARSTMQYDRDDHEVIIRALGPLEDLADLTLPARSQIYALRGLSHRSRERYDLALAWTLTEPLPSDQRMPGLLRDRGVTYRQTGQYDGAGPTSTALSATTPTMPGPSADRGETYRQHGQYGQALVDFDRCDRA